MPDNLFPRWRYALWLFAIPLAGAASALFLNPILLRTLDGFHDGGWTFLTLAASVGCVVIAAVTALAARAGKRLPDAFGSGCLAGLMTVVYAVLYLVPWLVA